MILLITTTLATPIAAAEEPTPADSEAEASEPTDAEPPTPAESLALDEPTLPEPTDEPSGPASAGGATGPAAADSEAGPHSSAIAGSRSTPQGAANPGSAPAAEAFGPVSSASESTAPAMGATPSEQTPTPPPFEVRGLYSVWGLTQGNFMLGAEHPLDDAAYTVQMLRLDGRASQPGYGARLRLDVAQGWWGVDNDPNRSTVVGVDEEGNPTGSDAYNADAMFGNKGTHYGVHVDLAYGWLDLPGVPLQVRLGRQYYGVGHKIVLDMDYDGVQIEFTPIDDVSLQAWWAKVGEGFAARTLPKGVVMSDTDDYADADLFGLVGDVARGAHAISVYGLYYMDRSSQPDWSLLPNDLGYFRSRHAPNVSRALAVGATADGTLDVAEGLAYAFEVDWLTGADNVDNADHAGGLLDINNGQLTGYNAYLTLDQQMLLGVPLTAGILLGVGSGDADPTGGPGNLQRLQTMGFFPLTYVWEDSVMPDLEGITPQGLGSPVSRGYRELENTTALQARASAEVVKRVTLGASYTWLGATQPVRGFDAAGTPTGEGSRALGQEIDGKAAWVIPTKGHGASVSALGGIFLPGAAAGNLILGSSADLEPAWELKTVLALKF